MRKILKSNFHNLKYKFRLSNGYKESKDKLLNIIKEKEDDVDEIKSNHKYEEE
jgi:hypothetical protein